MSFFGDIRCTIYHRVNYSYSYRENIADPVMNDPAVLRIVLKTSMEPENNLNFLRICDIIIQKDCFDTVVKSPHFSAFKERVTK